MRVWLPIFNLIAIVILGFTIVIFFNIYNSMNVDFEQLRFNKAVEYSTELAFLNALSIEDIDTDYTTLGNVIVNPGNTLDLFSTMMCVNYDMSLYDYNRLYVQDAIDIMVLASGDGFYVTQLLEDDSTPNDNIDGNEYYLKWSPKIPYYVNVGNEVYAVDLQNRTAMGVSTNLYNINKPEDIIDIKDISEIGNIEDNLSELVNNQINKVILYELDRKRNKLDRAFEYKFTLPGKTTKSGVNPINGPGILVLMNSKKFLGIDGIDTISVSGFKVIKKVNVLAFKDSSTGIKYYCFEGQMDPEDIGTKYVIEDYYKSTYEAAYDGYKPHFGLLANKIPENY